MEQFIGCDAHKKFSVFVAVNEKGQAGEALRLMHDRQLYREFLARLPPHSVIAVEVTRDMSPGQRTLLYRFLDGPPEGAARLTRMELAEEPQDFVALSRSLRRRVDR